MKLSGRQRIWISIAVAWLVFIYFAIEPYEYDEFPRGAWKAFLILGPVPLACIAAILWIRAGLRNDESQTGHMSKAAQFAIAKRLEIGPRIRVRSYRFDPVLKHHTFEIERGEEKGLLVIDANLAARRTSLGVVQRLASQEVERQFDEFGGKRLTVTESGVRVELGCC